MTPTIEEVREEMRRGDYLFVCPFCRGSFWATSRVGMPNEEGYCKTEGCGFRWLRTEDGKYFFKLTSVNDVLSAREP